MLWTCARRCPYAHKNSGDTERRYHPRYYKTVICMYESDAKGLCTKHGPHCPYAHSALDQRTPATEHPTNGKYATHPELPLAPPGTLHLPPQLVDWLRTQVDELKWLGIAFSACILYRGSFIEGVDLLRDHYPIAIFLGSTCYFSLFEHLQAYIYVLYGGWWWPDPLVPFVIKID